MLIHVGWMNLSKADANLAEPLPTSPPAPFRALNSNKQTRGSNSNDDMLLLAEAEKQEGEALAAAEAELNADAASPAGNQREEEGAGQEEKEEEGRGDGQDENYVPPDSWTKCGARVAVDLYEPIGSKKRFLGRALVNVAALVSG